MNAGTTSKRSPLAFFALVFALAVPFWVLGALAKPLPPPISLSLSSFQGVGPLIAALIPGRYDAATRQAGHCGMVP